MMVKAVIFDVDGTVLDTERIYVDAWEAAARDLGYGVPRDLILRTRGIGKDEARRLMKSEIGESFDYDAVFNRRVERAEEMILAQSPILKNGASALLDYLKAQRVPMAVASSTNRTLTMKHLSLSGIDGYFSAFVTGDMIKRGKPAPDIYLKAAELLGLRPEDCLAVEDSPGGIVSAAKAGLLTALIPDIARIDAPTRALCAYVFDDLEALIPRIFAPNAQT